MTRVRETELYLPVKAFLQAQGYEVKAEIGAADVVAVRGGEDPVIVELKTGFTLALLHQAVTRQSMTDWVYVAVPRPKGRLGLRLLKDNTGLCRRLGLGLVTVRLADGLVQVHCDPATFQPRKVAVRRTQLLREFARRVGDPNTGGATRVGLVTAYRQDAVLCARHLLDGPCKGAVVARATGVARATRMMADDHYGWFVRLETGIYALTPKGRAALTENGDG
ncbi:DUF2161 domain-containing phosphodiesterase [Oceaniovalibus sp. ACAM 378]|jgi:hypothetical protein|uniref:DUF2161 domain-containing phosphodiesterase n=1 Tax=Oceaniovalibus sp. ACAM 378 TaxID=2599923 RepID=UPI0011DBAF13|nr:DUF2161 family putative PD-(D/E)XK-type phosphodiesterase [Oceaniovalibus sp. ACAM 378]TYB89121.1 hypothetical protein FQ320_09380 [Oceaniovalibus sp. ACAM 378]